MTGTRRILNLCVVLLSILYFSTTVTLVYMSPYLLSLLALPVPIIFICFMENRREAIVLALFGLAIGPLTEIACIAGGLWTYAETGGLPYIPLWLLPGWASFPVALVLITGSVLGRSFEGPVGPKVFPLALAGLLIEIALCVALGHSSLLALAAVILYAFLIFALARRRETLVLFFAGALIGPVCESVPIAYGAWSYALPELLGISFFMLPAYGIFAVLTVYGAYGLEKQLFRHSQRPES